MLKLIQNFKKIIETAAKSKKSEYCFVVDNMALRKQTIKSY